jgi:hypothetical protein
MLSKDKENKLIELFVAIDDFCLALEEWKKQQPQLQLSVTTMFIQPISLILNIKNLVIRSILFLAVLNKKQLPELT